jgi:hypothetical protein
MSITTSSISSGTAGSSYSQTFSASGGYGSKTWSKSGGPSGLTMSSSGTLSGTISSSASGRYSLTVYVTDALGTTASRSYTLNVSAVTYPTLTISTSSLSSATKGSSYSFTMSGSGGTGSGYSWSATGLPSGLSMSSGGVISGTPGASGNFSVVVRLQDSRGSSSQVSKTLSLSVAASVPENETGYPYPSGSFVRTVDINEQYTFSSPGLYGFYIIGSNYSPIWKVLRISSSFTVVCYSDGSSSSFMYIVDNANNYIYHSDVFIEATSSVYIRTDVYYIKA